VLGAFDFSMILLYSREGLYTGNLYQHTTILSLTRILAVCAIWTQFQCPNYNVLDIILLVTSALKMCERCHMFLLSMMNNYYTLNKM